MNKFSSSEKTTVWKNIFSALLVIVISILLILKQNVIKQSLDISIRLCLSSLIPAIFPFMILSDFLISNVAISNDSKAAKLFTKITGINGYGLLAFILGNICGFPIGAYISTELYKNGNIGENEYKRLLPISTNPSMAFVISGVGIAIRNSLTDGIKLYLSIFFATVISALIWRNSISATHFSARINKFKFSLVDSIKTSSVTLLNIWSFIFLFSIIINIICSFGLPDSITVYIAAILEMGNASSNIVKVNFPPSFSLAISAFALGFSGVSMFAQALSFADKSVKQSMYLKIKLTEGIIAFAIALVLSKI